MRGAFRSLAFSFALALVVVSPCAAAGRVVAIGDIHGEYDGLVAILKQSGLVDEHLRWSGGQTTFVQVGDYLDRGADVRKVMDLLMSLERSAPRRHGQAIVLLGNHELMNLTSAFHYTNPAAYAAFANRGSEKRRQNAYRAYAKLHEKLATRFPDAKLDVASEGEWMQGHPPGFIEYVEAFSPKGKYGQWLRGKKGIVKVDDSVFVHGGISPLDRVRTLDTINADVRGEITAFDRIREYLVAEGLILPFFTFEEMSEIVKLEQARAGNDLSEAMRLVLGGFRSVDAWSLYNPIGPFWFRGFAEWTDEEGQREIDALLARFGARRFVVGHTVTADKSIVSRFGGKVFLIDTGMLRGYFSGRGSALELREHSFVAIYEHDRVPMSPQAAARKRFRAYAQIQLLGNVPTSPNATPPKREKVAEKVSPGLHRSVWLGPDGKPLPFHSTTEVEQFLRSARVLKIQKKRLAGATKPQKMLVGNGAVRANAVFRSHHLEQENGRWETGATSEIVRDTWKSEIAAYRLALLLGVQTVPPVVEWEHEKEKGSLQLWIENAHLGFHPEDSYRKPSDPVVWQKHRDTMRVFDALIYNGDRHESNMLVDADGQVWWIDHSRAFLRERDILESALITGCDRDFFQHLKSVDDTTISREMAPYMGPKEIESLLLRRAKVVELLETRIREKGEGAVLFSLASGEL